MTEKKYIKHIGSRDFYEISHPFADRKDKYLSGKYDYKCIILGTFPSEKSEENDSSIAIDQMHFGRFWARFVVKKILLK